jgi:hypothetical protein
MHYRLLAPNPVPTRLTSRLVTVRTRSRRASRVRFALPSLPTAQSTVVPDATMVVATSL